MVTSVSQYTPLGRIPSQRKFTVVGIYDTGSNVDEELVYTNIQDAGRLLHFKSDQMSGWRLYLDDPFVVTELEQQPLPNHWQWTDWRAQRGELFQPLKWKRI